MSFLLRFLSFYHLFHLFELSWVAIEIFSMLWDSYCLFFLLLFGTGAFNLLHCKMYQIEFCLQKDHSEMINLYPTGIINKIMHANQHDMLHIMRQISWPRWVASDCIIQKAGAKSAVIVLLVVFLARLAQSEFGKRLWADDFLRLAEQVAEVDIIYVSHNLGIILWACSSGCSKFSHGSPTLTALPISD